MIIGFDAKRAVHNQTGLGNYSRTLIEALATGFPDNEYRLYTPSLRNNPRLSSLREKANVKLVLPRGSVGRVAPALWRLTTISGQAKKEGVELYHGLTNELPMGLERAGIKSVVTIHDVIFERFGELYRRHDRMIYRWKTRHACRNATVIVAVSEQTKSDLVEYYGVNPSQIKVIYQACDSAFDKPVSEGNKSEVRQKYGLPTQYILYVGTIERRKNLLSLLQAAQLLRKSHDPYVVALGRGSEYLEDIERYIKSAGIGDRVKIIPDAAFADFPAIYQSALTFVYPSLFEGFGIPIIEALWSKLPVITSKGGCFAEAGGGASLYVDPRNPEELAGAIARVLNESTLRMKMITAGYTHVQKFRGDKVASEMMALYRTVTA